MDGPRCGLRFGLKVTRSRPTAAQRRKRFQTVNQFPKTSGRSRQGAPVRTIHKIPSRDRRLSSPLRPGSPFLPGRSGAIRSHCASVRTARIKVEFPFFNLESDFHFLGNLLIPASVYRP
jgi:hypothetical protein